MSKTTSFQKLSLSLRFLVGLKHPAVQKALSVHGFTAETLEEGWRLLVAAGRAGSAPEEELPAAVDSELVAFQKRWFPVTRIVLRAHAHASEVLLGSLEVEERFAASLAVSRFLARLGALAQSPSEAERRIRAILHARGLTDEVERAGRELLARSSEVVAAPLSVRSIEPGALAALWAWYLEWQGFTRRSVSNKNLLRSLGLTSPRARSAESNPSATRVLVMRESTPKKIKILTQRRAGASETAREPSKVLSSTPNTPIEKQKP